MKDKIKQLLKTKYAAMGFSDKVLDQAAVYFATVVKEEKDIETTISGVGGLLKAFQSEVDSVRTEKTAAEKKLAEIEAKGNGGTPEDEPKKNDDQTPEWAKSILESNKKLAEKMAAMEGEKITSTRKQQLSKIISKLPELQRKPYSHMRLDGLTDEEFSSLKTDITTEVEELAKVTNAKGAVFGSPSSVGKTTLTEGEKKANEEKAKEIVKNYHII